MPELPKYNGDENALRGFRGAFAFLSNMYPCSVRYNGRMFRCSEAAYQSAKCADLNDIALFTSLSGPEAKKAGRKARMRNDWEAQKVEVMRDILSAKFRANAQLREMLCATKGRMLVEENFWHDNFWGDCVCERCKAVDGKNMLGKLLMELREQLLFD